MTLRANDPRYTKLCPPVVSLATAADVLAASLGPNESAPIIQRKAPFGGGLPVETEVDFSEVSSTLSNPNRWNNNFAKKMLDMQFFFSCGPLRVAKSTPEHWNRLHASHKTLMPLPGGRMELFEEKVPHVSDAELEAMANSIKCSGKYLKYQLAETKRSTSPTGLPRRQIDTPLLQHLLKSHYVAPLPVKPKPDDAHSLMQRRRNQIAGIESVIPTSRKKEECDSVFSRTTVCSSFVSDAEAKPVATSVADATADSTAERRSGATAKSDHSRVSSSSSRVSKLRESLAKERSLSAMAMDHIRAASQQLDEIERVLASRSLSTQQAA